MKSGISLVYYALIIVVLATIVMVFFGFQLVNAVRRGDAAAEASAFNVIRIAVIVRIIGMIIGFIGKLFCLSVPRAVGASGAIFTSVAIDTVTIAVSLASFAVEFPREVNSILGLAGLLAYVLFVIFLGRLSHYIDRQDLVRRANGILTMGGVIIGAMLFGIIAARAIPIVALIALLVGLVLILLLLARYARLLYELKRAL
ncbi:MAG: hypothetical protein KY476_09655 [Planctomycetes bacterium]|nr:hypothetical protein [Planctomycetota bacterium]